MTKTPDSHAETPDCSILAGPDLLSEVLKSLRLTGSVFLNGRFTAPFGVKDPTAFHERTPMARLRHISILHLIVAGGCNFETAGERRWVTKGDLIFCPLPGQYQIWNGEPERFAEPGEVLRPSPIEGLWAADYGGGGDETRMVCGYIESAELLFAPIFRSLPALIVEHTSEDKVTAPIASMIREIQSLVEASAPGSQAVLGRLMELLFIELLRRHAGRLRPEARGWFAALRPGARGWFAALNDPIVGRTLQLLHAEPARHWTIEEIAHRVGSSRSVVAGRFKALLGRPPIDYLASWRIQLAADRLRAGHESVSKIAAGVGYESEVAFNRAFKRITGMTPGSWRDGAISPAPSN